MKLKQLKIGLYYEYRNIGYIRNLSELNEEERYYKPARVSNFWSNILNSKVTVIEVKHHYLKNILIKLDHI